MFRSVAKYRIVSMREFLNITKALADENRVRTLLALRQGELCVCQITELLALAPSTVSSEDGLHSSDAPRGSDVGVGVLGSAPRDGPAELSLFATFTVVAKAATAESATIHASRRTHPPTWRMPPVTDRNQRSLVSAISRACTAMRLFFEIRSVGLFGVVMVTSSDVDV